jgi:hypothetical protein
MQLPHRHAARLLVAILLFSTLAPASALADTSFPLNAISDDLTYVVNHFASLISHLTDAFSLHTNLAASAAPVSSPPAPPSELDFLATSTPTSSTSTAASDSSTPPQAIGLASVPPSSTMPPPTASPVPSLLRTAPLTKAPSAYLATATFSNIDMLSNLAGLLQSLNTYLASSKTQSPSSTDVQEQVAAGGNPGTYNFIPASQRIDQLSNTTISSPSITGGSISGTSVAGYLPLAGGALTGDLTGTDLNLSGTLTAGTLNVGGLSSSGALFAPYFIATSTTATSTFAGGFVVNNDASVHGIVVGIGAGNGGAGGVNTAFGFNALGANTTGFRNTAIGQHALEANTTGSQNTAIGRALEKNTTGTDNTAIGRVPLLNNTTGSFNIALGNQALQANSTGSGNIGIGYQSLFSASSTQNIALGYLAGSSITTGSYNVLLGGNSGASIATLSNYILFSDGAGNERFRVDNNGNFGIGTASPTYLLDVNGTGHFNSLVDAASFVATSTTATSTFAGSINVAGSNGLTVVPNAYGGVAPIATLGGIYNLNEPAPAIFNLIAQDTGSMNITRYGGQYGVALHMRVAAGTQSAPTAYSSLYSGAIDFEAYNGTGFSGEASIGSANFGGVTATSSAGSLYFTTTNPGSVGASQKLNITASGDVTVGSHASTPNATFAVAQSASGSGTVSNDPGGTTVTGWNTEFQNVFKVGDTITIGGQTVTILAIASQTSMTTTAIPSAHSFASFTQVGGPRFSVFGNGHIGIGTSSPLTTLSIQGAAGANDVLNVASSTGASMLYVDATGQVAIPGRIVVGTSTFGTSRRLVVVNTSGSGQNAAFGNSDFGTGTGTDLQLSMGAATGNTYVRLQAWNNDESVAGPLVLQPTNSSNSFLGIGNTAPTYKLDVTGLGHFTGLVDAANFVATSTTATSTFAGGLTAGSQFVVQQGSGNVGIGVAAPASRLDLRTTNPTTTTEPAAISVGVGDTHTSQFINFSDGTSGAIGVKVGIQFGGYQGYGFGGLYGVMTNFGGNTLGDLTFDLKNGVNDPTLTERMRITSAGYVGIGTTSPTAQLSTTGTVRFSNFGAGTLQTDANGNLSVSSDERLKNIQGNFSRGLADIQKISPILYQWKPETGYDASTTYAGFSAQNVQAAIPEAVGQDSHGYLTLQDRPLIAALVNAEKEIGTISGSFKTALIAWLGDAGNGIGNLFAKDIYASNITTQTVNSQRDNTQELCISEGANDNAPLCVTKPQLAAILAAAGQQPAPAPLPAASSTPNIMSASSTPSLLTSPVIQINGNNPAIVAIGTAYADLGASITGPQQDLNLGIATFLNGTKVDAIQLDTSTTSTSTIDYVVTDQFGTTATATRTVIVQPAASI